MHTQILTDEVYNVWSCFQNKMEWGSQVTNEKKIGHEFFIIKNEWWEARHSLYYILHFCIYLKLFVKFLKIK